MVTEMVSDNQLLSYGTGDHFENNDGDRDGAVNKNDDGDGDGDLRWIFDKDVNEDQRTELETVSKTETLTRR